MSKYDALELENQLCFPLYVSGKEVTRLYKPYLDEIDLTYTQYVTMMVMWKEKTITLKELGKRLFLDSGTLTPLLRKLEEKGYIKRQKDKNDFRNLIVEISDKGMELRDKAIDIPEKIAMCIDLDKEDAAKLYEILHKLMDSFKEDK